MESYDTWNEAFADHFFRPAYHDRPVLLHVDDVTLKIIGRGLGLEEDKAEDSFLGAIRGQLPATSNSPFSPIHQRSTSWRLSKTERKQTTPPFLAVLGLCVLAASRMHAESATRTGAGNFYERLNQLLGRPGRTPPEDFQKTEDYWRLLADWLNVDNRKERGVFKLQAIANKTFIGSALSQCLLREVDKEHLRKFFRDVNMSPRLAEDPKALLPKLLKWYKCNPNSLSVPARRLLQEGDADTLMLMAEAVAAEARQSTRPMAANIAAARQSSLALRIDVERGGRQFDLKFLPIRHSRFAEGAFSSYLGTFELVALDIEGWYRPIPLDPEIVFDKGIELRRDDLVIRWKARKVLAAVHNLDLGGYVSPCKVALGRSILVLCHESVRPKLEQYLAEHAEPDWRPAPGTMGLPTSWYAYLDVVLSSVADTADPDLECLVPSRQAKSGFEGGLRVAEMTWLVGAEPTFHHTAAEPGHLAIYVDGKLVLQTENGSATIHLADLHLSPENHEVRIRDLDRRTSTHHIHPFTTVLARYHDLNSAPSRNRMLGHDLVYDGQALRATYPSPRQLGPDGRPHPGVRIEGARIEADPEIGLGLPATAASPVQDESNITWSAPRLL